MSAKDSKRNKKYSNQNPKDLQKGKTIRDKLKNAGVKKIPLNIT